MKNRLIVFAAALLCFASIGFLLARYVRPRAFPKATLIVSTPNNSSAVTCGIVPQIESVGSMNLTFSVNDLKFTDADHQLTASWSYLGGAFGRDWYRISTSFDGRREVRTVSPSGMPVVVFSNDGYQVRLHAESSVYDTDTY